MVFVHAHVNNVHVAAALLMVFAPSIEHDAKKYLHDMVGIVCNRLPTCWGTVKWIDSWVKWSGSGGGGSLHVLASLCGSVWHVGHGDIEGQMGGYLCFGFETRRLVCFHVWVHDLIAILGWNGMRTVVHGISTWFSTLHLPCRFCPILA